MMMVWMMMVHMMSMMMMIILHNCMYRWSITIVQMEVLQSAEYIHTYIRSMIM